MHCRASQALARPHASFYPWCYSFLAVRVLRTLPGQ